MESFWFTLSRPFLTLAPMEDVTDTVFRQIVARCGRPDVFFTEFVSADGLQSRGRDILLQKLLYDKSEHPIVAQIWGKDPKNYYKTAQLVASLGFDGIDINMGCPVRNVIVHGSCSALIKNPTLAAEIIAATKEGAGLLPVSVKTRIGFDKQITDSWIPFLLEQKLAVITIHARTAKELSKVPARWDEIGKAVLFRDQMKAKTLIIGNGDIVSVADAMKKVAMYNVDGVMIGRGIFSDPYIFNKTETIKPTTRQLLELMRTHVNLFEKTWGLNKNYSILKKFFKIYANGFEGASAFREELMKTGSSKEVLQLIEAKLLTII